MLRILESSNVMQVKRRLACLTLCVLSLGACKTSIITAPNTLTGSGANSSPASGGNLGNYFLYVGVTSGVDVYPIDSSTGLPTASATNISLCGGGFSAIDPTQTFGYVGCGNDNTFYTYLIDHATGLPTGAPVHAFSSALAGAGLALSPNGRFMIGSDWNGNINWVTVDPTAGTFSAGGTLDVTAYCAAASTGVLTVDHTSHFAYLGCWGGNVVNVFTLNPTTGAPTHAAAFDTAVNCPAWVGASPSTNQLVVTDQFGNGLDVYTINADGSLSQVGSELSMLDVSNTYVGPYWGSFDPTGAFFFTFNQGDYPTGQSEFVLSGAGTLTAVNPSFLDAWGMGGGGSNGVSFLSGLPFAYVGNGATITLLNFNSTTGALSLRSTFSSAHAGATWTGGVVYQ